MENTLSQLDGKILAIGLLAVVLVWILGWFFGWVFYRSKAQDVLAHSRAEAQAKAANVEALKHDLAQRDRTAQEHKDEIAAFHEERSDLEHRIKSQDADISNLTAEIEMLETLQFETESDDENIEIVSALEDTVADLRAQLSSEKQRQEQYLAKLMTEKAVEAEELNNLKSQNLSLLEKSAEQGKTIHRLSGEVATAVGQLHEHKKELARARAPSNTSASTIQQLQDKVAQLHQIKDKNLGEISNLQSSLAIWQHKAATAEKTIADSSHKLRLLEKQIDEAGKANPSYDRLLEIKEQEILEQKKKTHLTQRHLVAVRDEVVSRDKDIERLNEMLQKQKIQQRHELSLMARNLEQQQSATAETIDQHLQKNQLQVEKITKLTHDHATIARQLLKANSSINELDERNRSLLNKFNAVEENLSTKLSELSKLADANQELEKRFASFNHESEETRRMLRKTTAELQASIDANENLRAELEIQLAANQALEKAQQTTVAQAKAESAGRHQPPFLLADKPAQVDDLKRIKGIGPSLEKLLNRLGIYQFSQLAQLTGSEVAWVDEHIETFKGRIYRDNWVSQAKQLT